MRRGCRGILKQNYKNVMKMMDSISHYETWVERPAVITQHHYTYIQQIVFHTWYAMRDDFEDNLVAIFKIKWK